MSKVLIIDDEVKDSTELFRVIEAKGHQLNALDNVNEALAYLARERVDLVILDIVFPLSKDSTYDKLVTDMGRRTGIELLKEINRMGHVPPIVMLSARRPEAFEKMCLESGAKKYLAKPITPKHFWGEIKEYLENGE